MTIIVRVKDVYGVKRVYPVCDKAKLLVELTGQKTFCRASLDKVKKLGYILEVEGIKL